MKTLTKKSSVSLVILFLLSKAKALFGTAVLAIMVIIVATVVVVKLVQTIHHVLPPTPSPDQAGDSRTNDITSLNLIGYATFDTAYAKPEAKEPTSTFTVDYVVKVNDLNELSPEVFTHQGDITVNSLLQSAGLSPIQAGSRGDDGIGIYKGTTNQLSVGGVSTSELPAGSSITFGLPAGYSAKNPDPAKGEYFTVTAAGRTEIWYWNHLDGPNGWYYTQDADSTLYLVDVIYNTPQAKAKSTGIQSTSLNYVTVIERSTDLINWIPVKTNIATSINQPYTFTDTTAPMDSAFYRLNVVIP